MQVLTTTGYKNIEDCVIGEELVAYEVGTGNPIVNTLLGKQWFSPDMFVDEYSVPEPTFDEEGNPILDEEGNPVMSESVLIKTKEQIFVETYGELDFLKINDTWTLFKNQSIWDNLNVVHVKDLQIGDTVYNGSDNDVTIDSIEEGIADGWWRLTVSGDHSYIADNLTLHNASRYWVGGGSANTWIATGNTNWGSTSGGTNNASVPTSADDVIFDGAGTNGNTASTISATITILSLNITTGYTSTMTHNAVLTIAGNLTYTSGYTRAGSSGVTIASTSTLTSNGVVWNLPLTFVNSITITLSGNLSVSGLLTSSNATTFNKTASETLTLSGGVTTTGSIVGNVDIYLTGGTWQGSSTTGIANNLFLNGNITISGTVYYGTGTLTYSSGTITITGTTLNIVANCTLNTNGITWNNITIGSRTITLTSNLSMTGLFIGNGTTFNKTTSETVTVGGGITANGSIVGTADLYLTGGTWSGTGTVNIALYINGNVTVSGSVEKNGNPLTYVSGTVITTGSTLNISSTITLNTNGIVWNNITSISTIKTITLTSNLSMTGLLTITNTTTINKTASETVTVGGGMTINAVVNGSANIIFTGGTWSAGFNCDIVNDLTLNGNSTISGTVYYKTGILTFSSGTITTTSSTLNIDDSCTLNTNGMTWANISSTIIAKTITLTSNLLMTGLFKVNFATTVNSSTSSTWTTSGGVEVNAINLQGNAKIILTGGSWVSGAANRAITNNIDINGNVTISGSVYYLTGTINYISGSVTTTGSTLYITGSVTLNTNGITWNNIQTQNTLTITLTSNFSMSGLLTIGSVVTINKTASETVTVGGGMTMFANLVGTADLYLTGGTWNAGTAAITNPMFLNGNITITGTFRYATNTLTYLGGNINTTGSTFVFIGSTTLNTNGIVWNNVLFASNAQVLTLTSNFTMSGSATSSQNTVINKTTNESWNFLGDVNLSVGTTGTATINFLNGSSWTYGSIGNDVVINGYVTLGYMIKNGGTLTYQGGKILSNSNTPSAILDIIASCTIINFHKVPLKYVVIAASQTITMDRFFTGTPSQICNVYSKGANYTIVFTDNFERMGLNVAVSGATLARPLQLVVITNPRFNTNKATNSGIRYTNQSPNGVPRNRPAIPDTSGTVPALGLVSDPNFIKQG